jgi:hypothetical protein
MAEPEPKLRVIDEVTEEPSEVVRLGAEGVSVEKVERLPGRKADEAPARIEGEVRENFEGRSLEPGVEAILETKEVVANVEQPWGIGDGRLAGVPYGWFVLIALALVAGGVWSVLEMREGELQLEIDHGVVKQKVAEDREEVRAATVLVEEVERVIAANLRAESVEELLPLVRDPERVRPMIEATWAAEPRRPMKFVRMSLFEPAVLSDRPFWMLRVEVEEGEAQSLLVEQTGETGVKVDWETHVCYQPMSWDRFVSELPASEALDFRLWAEPDSLFSHEFSGEGRWVCYRLTAKDSDGYLFGYVQAESEVAARLGELSRISPGRKATVILRLRRPPGSASPRGVVIEEVVAPRWILVEEKAKDSP